MASILIGTSGWQYDSWKKRFYPPKLKENKKLEFYSREFNTVEINYSFYKLPAIAEFERWKKEVPKDFLFAVKASRYLTHNKKLKDAEDSWDRVLTTSYGLGSKLGPVLLQFPQRWKVNVDRLDTFLSMVKKHSRKKPRLVFEFRNDTWFSKDVFKILSRHNAALCIADTDKFPTDDTITADFAYFRYHGRGKSAAPNYSDEYLAKQAKKMKRLLKDGIDVYAYFNNDNKGRAIENARTLIDLMS